MIDAALLYYKKTNTYVSGYDEKAVILARFNYGTSIDIKNERII